MNTRSHLTLSLIILCLSTACQKSIQISTAESDIIPVNVQPICPKAEEIDYDKVYELFSYEPQSDDGTECNDGRLYCYGPDNAPILQPDNAQGWRCQYVSKMPNDENYQRLYMYNERIDLPWDLEYDYHRYLRKYTSWAFMKSWICESEQGCICGSNSCPQNAQCIDNQCFCNDAPYSNGACQLALSSNGLNFRTFIYDTDQRPEYDFDSQGKPIGIKLHEGYYQKDNYLPSDSNEIIYYTSKKPKLDTNGKAIEGEYEFYCNDNKIVNSELQHCIMLPDGRIALHLEYFKDPISCFWNDTNDDSCIDSQQSINGVANIKEERLRRASNPLYQCGQETCILGETCLSDHCVGLGTLKPLPTPEYTWGDYQPQCMHESGCKCGDGLCEQGQFCIESSCTDTPYRRLVNGKWIEYESVTTEFYNLMPPEEDSVPDRHSPPLHPVWFEILTDKRTEACDSFPQPENIEDYVCIFDGREDGCGEAPQMYVGSAGYRCIKSEGCRCGDITIPQNAGCRNGQADYDALYQTLACHHEMNYYYSDSESAISKMTDERGWCKCGRSIVPPNMKGYYCDKSAMICKQSRGCECGDAICEYDEACITPGKCQK